MGKSNVTGTPEYHLGRLSSDIAYIRGDVREIKERLVKVEEKLDSIDEGRRSRLRWILGGMGALGLLIISVV